MVERYDLEIYSQGAAGQCGVDPNPEGEFVLFTDYQKLEEDLKYTQERLSEWEDCQHDGAVWYDISGRERCGKCGCDVP